MTGLVMFGTAYLMLRFPKGHRDAVATFIVGALIAAVAFDCMIFMAVI